MLIKKLNLSVTKKSLKLRDKIIRVTCLPTGRLVSIRVIRNITTTHYTLRTIQ